ncbi:MAG: helix-turn-helix transcriptional regulator [Eubacteriales bacterium]
MENTTYSLGVDDLYVIPPKTLHALKVGPQEDQYSLEVKFNLNTPLTEGLAAKVAALPPVIHNCPPAIKTLMYNIWSESFHQKKYYHECVRDYTYILLYQLVRFYEQENLPHPVMEDGLEGMEHRALIQSILQYLEQNIEEKLLLDDLAGFLGYNKSYLCKTFKRECGLTIREYYNVIRIREAQKLLHETEMSVTEVGEKLGFESDQHFNRLFKNLVGVSPGVYKKNHVEGLNRGISIQSSYVNPDELILHNTKRKKK